ncbi:MAG: response regulator [Candidatus Korobacteraceae bacterium]
MPVAPSRREPRFPLQVATLVFGFDRAGRAFMEQAQTLDISSAGIRLIGVSSEVAPGSILAVQQGGRRARFQVLWVGDSGSDLAGHIGLQCVEVGGHTRKRILYLEADEAERALRRSYLETAGYEFICHADVQKAMQELQAAAFDLLLIDVAAGQSGLEEITTFVRQNSPRTRIMLLSRNPGRIPPPLLNQADGFVPKSGSRHELLIAVEEMIGPGNQIRWPLARLAARYQIEMPVAVLPRRLSLQQEFQGASTDISELGVGIELAEELVLGELVGLRFRLPGSHHDLTLRASVRRRTGSHYGLEFVSIERERLEEIRLACRNLPRLSLPQPV